MESFIVVLIYISLTINEVQHQFLPFLATWVPSSVKCVFTAFIFIMVPPHFAQEEIKVGKVR